MVLVPTFYCTGHEPRRASNGKSVWPHRAKLKHGARLHHRLVVTRKDKYARALELVFAECAEQRRKQPKQRKHPRPTARVTGAQKRKARRGLHR